MTGPWEVHRPLRRSRILRCAFAAAWEPAGQSQLECSELCLWNTHLLHSVTMCYKCSLLSCDMSELSVISLSLEVKNDSCCVCGLTSWATWIWSRRFRLGCSLGFTFSQLTVGSYEMLFGISVTRELQLWLSEGWDSVGSCTGTRICRSPYFQEHRAEDVEENAFSDLQ